MKTQLIITSVVAVLLAVAAGVGFWMYFDTKMELAGAETQLTTIGDQLADTEAELASTEAELEAIEAKYPLRSFDNYAELSNWADAHLRSYSYADNLDEFNAACGIASEAMNEGLLVWVDYDVGESYIYTYCCAFVGNTLYYWCPHSTYYDGIQEVTYLYRVSSSF